MSKLKPDNINFDGDFVIVKTDKIATSDKEFEINNIEENILEKEHTEAKNKADLIIQNANKDAQEIIKNAKIQAEKILAESKEKAKIESENIISNANKDAQEILDSATNKAKNLEQQTKKESEKLIESSKEEIEKAKIDATNEGYKDGYQDANQKIQEELEEKIENLETFCNNQYEIRNKVLKSASKDILDIIINISRKILHKEIDANILDKIIKSTILLFEKKENINIILSEKYAKLLFEIQKKSLTKDIEFEFENFKQYEGFNIIYNPKFDEDTIIIDNLKERFDASINSQMDTIIRDIMENTKNGQIEISTEYIEEKSKNEL